MAAANPRLRRFGRCTYDPLTGELDAPGRHTRLAPQPAALLAALLDRPGDLVTRETLRLRIWPDGTFVDFAHGLHAAVSKIRLSLGDSAREPHFVETLPRRGYRFVAPVEEGAVAEAVRDANEDGGAVRVVSHAMARAGERWL